MSGANQVSPENRICDCGGPIRRNQGAWVCDSCGAYAPPYPNEEGEYEALEKDQCEHGVWPSQRCEDCLYVPDLPCGADL